MTKVSAGDGLQGATNLHPQMCPTKPTTKIRFTEPQIAFVMRAHPNCNLDHVTELCFEFDQVGKIVDCSGTIKDRVLRHQSPGMPSSRSKHFLIKSVPTSLAKVEWLNRA